MYAGHIESCVDGASGGHRRGDAAGHRGEHLHADRQLSPARRARSTTGPITSMSASTSAAVDVWPRLNRSELRARSSSCPIDSSTWLGRATPAEHAEPVEHSIPRASRSSSNESPSHPGNEKCALPGSRESVEKFA